MEFLDSNNGGNEILEIEEISIPDYEWFKDEFYKLSTIQLNYYKENQMKRRINTLMEKRGIDGYEAFISLLHTNEKELASFIDYITINVTEFFRTPEHFHFIENEIVPIINKDSQEKTRIWCAACSSGEEPYSVAMSMLNFWPPERIEIIATDIDEGMIAKAKKGIYDERSIVKLPERYLDRYFTQKESNWMISDEVKSCIGFRQMDLLKDEYPTDLDMIICRNVLIYFTEEAKQMIYRQFRDSLKQEGYLFTGDTEQIVYHKLYGFKKEKNFLYLKYGEIAKSIFP